MSSCEFCEFSKNTFFIERLWTTASRGTNTTNTHENSTKNQTVTEWHRCGNGQWTNGQSACVATRLKPLNTLNYWV